MEAPRQPRLLVVVSNPDIGLYFSFPVKTLVKMNATEVLKVLLIYPDGGYFSSYKDINFALRIGHDD